MDGVWELIPLVEQGKTHFYGRNIQQRILFGHLFRYPH